MTKEIRVRVRIPAHAIYSELYADLDEVDERQRGERLRLLATVGLAALREDARQPRKGTLDGMSQQGGMIATEPLASERSERGADTPTSRSQTEPEIQGASAPVYSGPVLPGRIPEKEQPDATPDSGMSLDPLAPRRGRLAANLAKGLG